MTSTRHAALAALLWTLAAGAAAADAALCQRWAARAAEERGIPLPVMMAITLTETGRERGGAHAPWPWTVNMEGAGHWFDSRDEALAYVYREFRRGARSFDVGCFQINFKWHGQHFDSIEEMFDPAANARYAARFLSDLHAELGSWDAAAGAYHSRTPKHANRYRARFRSFRSRLEDEGVTLPAPETAPAPPARSAPRRLAARPLVQGEAGRLGSLVPLGGPVAGPLGQGG